MKIMDNMGSFSTQGSKNPSPKARPEQSFSEVLGQVAQGPVEASSSLTAGISIPPLGGVDPVNPSGPAMPLSQSEEETSIAAGLIDELETTLHALDNYRKKLSDASVPVDDLADIIGHLEDRVDRLQSLSAVATTPEGLKEVASGLMITMSTEIEKFRRGDYL